MTFSRIPQGVTVSEYVCFAVMLWVIKLMLVARPKKRSDVRRKQLPGAVVGASAAKEGKRMITLSHTMGPFIAFCKSAKWTF